MTSSSLSTANRTTRSPAKLFLVCPFVIFRMLLMAVEMCSSRSAMVGCTSKNFEDVVGDPLRELRGHGPAHGSLRLQSRRILNNVFNTNEVEN